MSNINDRANTSVMYKLLIVEDDKDLHFVINKVLKRVGIEPYFVSLGSEALDFIKKESLVLLLLDYHLPDIKSKDLIDEIHRLGFDCPFIIMTGYGDEKIAVEMMKKGARDYLVKDMHFIDLLPRVVRNHIDKLNVEANLLLSKQSLYETEEKYKLIVESASDGIVVIDEQMKIFEINKSFADFLEMTKEELIDANLNHFLIFRDNQQRIDWEELNQGKKLFFEGELKSRHKPYVSVEISMRVLPEGKYIGIVRDITLRKKAEEQALIFTKELEQKVYERTHLLEKTLKDLKTEIAARKLTEEKLIQARNKIGKAFDREKELNELKSRFIAMISHEYRTPLTIISNATYLLDRYVDQGETGKISDVITNIRTAIKNMTSLLEQVLSIDKIDKEAIITTNENIDLVKLINDTIAQVKESDKNNHKIRFINSPDEFTFYSDKDLLTLILQNLLVNSLKFSAPETFVDVELKEINNEVVITVSDNGIGIPQDEINHIFKPFFRGKNTISVPGTGLGLAIVKSCVDKLDGIISVKSEIDDFTMFQVTIPKSILK